MSSSYQAHVLPPPLSSTPTTERKFWVDPSTLPNASPSTLEHHSIHSISGNAPARAKRLALNTFAAYGVGGREAFGHEAGRKVRFVRIDVHFDGREEFDGDREESNKEGVLGSGVVTNRSRRKATSDGERYGYGGGGGSVSSVTAVAELVVDKSMVNGNGMMHGGCISYLIDNCASMPLVVLGILRGRNGVGVTQAMNVLFHAPAPLGSKLEIVSTSLALGGRAMSSRCEIFDKSTGRLVASAFINKMQPKL